MMKYISTNIFVSSLLMIKYGSLPVRVLMWVWMWVFPQCTLVIMLSPCSSPWMKEEPVDNKSINVRWLLIVHIINKINVNSCLCWIILITWCIEFCLEKENSPGEMKEYTLSQFALLLGHGHGHSHGHGHGLGHGLGLGQWPMVMVCTLGTFDTIVIYLLNKARFRPLSYEILSKHIRTLDSASLISWRKPIRSEMLFSARVAAVEIYWSDLWEMFANAIPLQCHYHHHHQQHHHHHQHQHHHH